MKIKSSIKPFLAMMIMCQFIACQNDDAVICTEEFRVIGIEVSGKTLDNWYTVRISTNDTFTLNSGFQNMYPVLDDNFQSKLEKREETFVFHGLIADSVRIVEPFRIKADECHIQYVSGNTKVTL